jgi:hypothetical protein
MHSLVMVHAFPHLKIEMWGTGSSEIGRVLSHPFAQKSGERMGHGKAHLQAVKDLEPIIDLL